jgi:hypothetical protein
MIIRTAKIFVKLEAGVSEQIPLIGLSLTCCGEITNWTSKLGLSLTATIDMAYFNEAKSVWEPVIEPTEQKNDRLTPFSLSIEVITYKQDLNKSSSVCELNSDCDLLNNA